MAMVRRTFAVVVALCGCTEDGGLDVREEEICFTRRDGAGICIETYEASRRDATDTSPGVSDEPPRSFASRRPWVEITWSAARDACLAKGRRLCERDEWFDACSGAVGEGNGTRYPYGAELDEAVCNVTGTEPVAGGSFAGCVSGFGAFDLAGNVWEWTGNSEAAAVARGGGFRSSVAHECRSGDDLRRFDPRQANVEVGFRCCRDV